MSRSSFARNFKATVGKSPFDYLARWRTLLAGSRLTDGNQRVSRIAGELGYESENAFTAAFKRVMGCSPSQYARMKPATRSSHPWPTTAVGEQASNIPLPASTSYDSWERFMRVWRTARQEPFRGRVTEHWGVVVRSIVRAESVSRYECPPRSFHP